MNKNAREKLIQFLPIFIVGAVVFGLTSCSEITSSFQVEKTQQLKQTNTITDNIYLRNTEYEIIEISSERPFNVANAINDYNLVTGTTRNSSGEEFPFKWDEDKGFSLLPLPEGYLGRGKGINNSGTIVGEILSPLGRAFLWSESIGFKLLTPPVQVPGGGDTMYRANDINSKNEVVGISFFVDSPNFSASMWTDEGGLKPLGELDGYDICEAVAINENSEVAGYCWKILSGGSSSERRAFYWSQATGMVDIGTFSGNSSASDINDNGYVVGISQLEDDSQRAFLWSYGESIQNLGTAGGTFSNANSINNLGFIAGEGTDINNDNSGFVWKESFGFKPLPILNKNLALGTPNSINEVGIMAGFAINENFTFSAVLYKPVESSDTEPPLLSYSVLKTSLWPPNHKMNLVISGITSLDNKDSAPELDVLVSSNEAENGTGDGNTEEDWKAVEQADGTFDVYVRAERNGDGTGRIYTVDITSTDASGNTASESLIVKVEHDKS